MPAFLLHITASDLLAERPDVPEPFAEAFRVAPGYRRLGAVFVDLPYFGGFPLQVVRHLLGAVRLDEPWGQIFHARGPGRLALALVEGIRRRHLGVGRAGLEPIAFLGGYLSHHAMDRLIHPIVQREVRRRLGDEGGEAAAHHSQVEKFQSLFFHEDYLGHCMAGTPYPRSLTASFPGATLLRPRLPDPTASLVESACLEVHARAPSRRSVNGWIRWTRWYGELLSSRHGGRDGLESVDGSRAALRERYYEQPQLRRHVDRAGALTRDYLEVASEGLDDLPVHEPFRAHFLATVPDICLDMGA